MNPEFFRNMSKEDFRAWLNDASDEEMSQALAVIMQKLQS